MHTQQLNLLLLIIGLISLLSCDAQTVSNRLSINIPTIAQEASSIWRTINDIEFLETQGYNVELPKDKWIDSLIIKSKNGTFGNEDYQSIYELLESGVYNEKDYQMAADKVSNEEQLINKIIQQIEAASGQWDWEFELFDTYTIIFTLYGSGGSYDPNTGAVTLFTTYMGEFKNYENPVNTIIHEITHLGMESSIVQKYNLSHVLKERVIDKFVYLMFGELLPHYKIQNMGDTEIDQHLENKADFRRLESIIKQLSL